jgi:hypothetical protein
MSTAVPSVIKTAPASVAKVIEKKWVQMLLAVSAIVVCVTLVSYAAYKVFATSLKMVKVTRDGLIPADGPGAIVPSSSIPSAVNGAEFGYGVWVYLERAEKTKDPKQILHQGNVRMVMGKDDNSLSLQFQQTGDVWSGVSTDYVPLARWVHIVTVYREGAVTFFMDGEVESVMRLPPSAENHDVPSASLTVGGGGSSFRTSTWQGYIGSVVCLNYFPSATDVKKMYYAGPVEGGTVMKWMGMKGYGVRSPVYRLNGK